MVIRSEYINTWYRYCFDYAPVIRITHLAIELATNAREKSIQTIFLYAVFPYIRMTRLEKRRNAGGAFSMALPLKSDKIMLHLDENARNFRDAEVPEFKL